MIIPSFHYQELAMIGMFFSSFFFCMCTFALIYAGTLVCVILLLYFLVILSPFSNKSLQF